jgi:hypothetical protein
MQSGQKRKLQIKKKTILTLCVFTLTPQKKMGLSDRATERLQRLHGDSYLLSAICDLHTNKTKSKTYNVLIGNGFFSNIKDALSALTEDASIVWNVTTQIISGISWEAVALMEDVPIFLESMVELSGQIVTATGERLRELVASFFAGANQLWDYINNLIFSKGSGLTKTQIDKLRVPADQIKALVSLLAEYGAQIVSLMHFLFKEIQNLIVGIIGLYQAAIDVLVPMCANFLTTVYEVCPTTQDVKRFLLNCMLFPFVAIQEGLELLRGGMDVFRNFIIKCVKEAFDHFKEAFVMNIQIPNILSVMASYIPLQKIKRGFQWVVEFVGKILSYIPIHTAINYLTSFMSKCVNCIAYIFSSIYREIESALGLRDEFGELVKELKERLQTPGLRQNIVKDAKDTLERVDETNLETDLYLEERAREVFQNGPTKLFKNIWVGTTFFTRMYYNIDIPKEETEEYLTYRTGWNPLELSKHMNHITNRIQRSITAIKVSTEEKTKLDCLIGGEDDEIPVVQYQALKDAAKKLQEKIEKLKKAKREFAKTEEYDDLKQEMLDRIKKLEKTRNKKIEVFREQGYKTKEEDVEEEFQDDKKQAEEDFEEAVRLRIGDIDFQIQKKSADLAPILREIARLESATTGKAWDWATKICLAVVVAGAFFYLWKSYRATDDTLKVFDKIQAQTNFDPLIEQYIKQYDRFVAKETGQEKYKLGDLQEFVDRKIINITTLKEYVPAGLFPWSDDEKRIYEMDYNEVRALAAAFHRSAIVSPQSPVEYEWFKSLKRLFWWMTTTNVEDKKRNIEELVQNGILDETSTTIMNEVDVANLATPDLSYIYAKNERLYRNHVSVMLKTHHNLMQRFFQERRRTLYDEEYTMTQSVFSYILGAAKNVAKTTGLINLTPADVFDFEQALTDMTAGYVGKQKQRIAIVSSLFNFSVIMVQVVWSTLILILTFIFANGQHQTGISQSAAAAYGTHVVPLFLSALGELLKGTADVKEVRTEAINDLWDGIKEFGGTIIMNMIFPGFSFIWGILSMWWGRSGRMAAVLTSKPTQPPPQTEPVPPQFVKTTKAEPEPPKMVRTTRGKSKLNDPIRCMVCSTNVAQFREESNRNHVYCSQGCAHLRFHGKQLLLKSRAI